MSRSLALIVSVASLAMITGCASHKQAPLSRVVPQHTAEQKSASFDQVAKLAGEWRLTDDNGNIVEGEHAATTRFEVSSGGTTIREIMLLGQPMEMTNMYHFDGEQIVVTHYCAMGNQPRMRAHEVAPGRIAFKLDQVTNYAGKNQTCMGGLVLEMPDANTLREHWTSFENGKESSHATFTLRRVK